MTIQEKVKNNYNIYFLAKKESVLLAKIVDRRNTSKNYLCIKEDDGGDKVCEEPKKKLIFSWNVFQK